jgi:hypothetical protein
VSFTLEAGGTYYVGISGEQNRFYDPIRGTQDSSDPGLDFGHDKGAYTLALKLVAGGPVDPDDQIAEARAIAFATPTTGTIGVRDVDMFAFTVTGSPPVLYTLRGRPTDPDQFFQPVLSVFDASGNAVDVEFEPGGTLNVPGPGKYFVGVSESQNTTYDPLTGYRDALAGTGTYTLTLYRPPQANDPDDQIAEAAPTAIGSSKAGTIDNPQDVDLYAFQAVGGRGIAIDLDPSATSGIAASSLRVFDGQGRLLAQNEGGLAPGEMPPPDFGLTGDSYLEFFPSTSGTYYFGVAGSGNFQYDPLSGLGDVPASSAGGYRVTLSALPADADPDNQLGEAVAVAAPGTRSGTISTPNDIDFIKVTVTAGQHLGFDLDLPIGSKLDPFLRLFDVIGQELGRSDDDPAPGERLGIESYLERVFAQAGTYYVGISSHGNGSYDPASGFTNASPGGDSTGAYVLKVTKLP